MRTLHVGLKVADLDRAMAFYAALGYEVVGEVPETPIGHLVMLKLPGDEFVTVELVDGPEAATGSGLSHLVVQVDSMDEVVQRLARHGIDVEPPSSPDGTDGFLTAMLDDPDGNRIELVQWPPGHAAGMGPADFQEEG